MNPFKKNHQNVYEILNINLYVGKIHILKNISFKLKKYSITAILGGNGSGKSTLLNHLAMKYSNNGKNEINSFSFVTQKDYLDPYDTVAGQFKFQAQRDNIKQTKQDILSNNIYKAPPLNTMWTSRINSLSGGQKRSVALALSLIKKPDFLILDEPKPVVAQPPGKHAKISVNSPSINDCYYYVLEKKEGIFNDV